MRDGRFQLDPTGRDQPDGMIEVRLGADGRKQVTEKPSIPPGGDRAFDEIASRHKPTTSRCTRERMKSQLRQCFAAFTNLHKLTRLTFAVGMSDEQSLLTSAAAF